MAPIKMDNNSKAIVESVPITVSKFYDNEDRQAQNLTNDQISMELEEIVGFMRGQLDTGTDTLRKNDDARDALLLKAIMLRRLNRLSNFRNRLLRERLAVSRAKVDAHYLQLQNIRCGIAHLKSATAACLEFQSTDSELNLVPVEEFYERAPESISRPDVTRDDKHQLHLARLNFELEERVNMLGNLQELEGRKSVLLSDIHGKEQRLRQIKPKIEALKQCARPLLDILGLKSVDTSVPDSRKKFVHLPQQLELLRINVGVFNELFGERIDVIVDGDVQKAERFMLAEARRITVSSDDDEDEDADNDDVEEEDDEMDVDDDRDDSDTKSSKKSRKRKSRRAKVATAEKTTPMPESTASPDLADGGDRPSARSGAVVAANASSGRGTRALEKRLQQKRDALLNVHPISMSLVIALPNVDKHRNMKLRLSFYYLTELSCVGVKCKIVDAEISNWQLLDGETLLDNLFDGDSGRQCTNPIAKGLLNTLDMDITKYALVVGKPYDFAQRLCGLSVPTKFALGENGKNQTIGDRQLLELLVEMVERARARIASRFTLASAVAKLEALKGESVLSIVPNIDAFPAKIPSQMNSFSPLSAEDALSFSGISSSQRSLLQRLDNNSGAAAYYKLNVERFDEPTQSKFALDAIIFIPQAYPRHAPVFFLSIKSDTYRQSLPYCIAISDLERYVNAIVPEDDRFEDGIRVPDLFTFQVVALCSHLDVVEVTAQRLTNVNTSLAFSSELNYSALTRLA